jgi:hypothetical protein
MKGKQSYSAGHASLLLFVAFFACMSVDAVMEGGCTVLTSTDQQCLATIAITITLQKLGLHRCRWHTNIQWANIVLIGVRVAMYAVLFLREWDTLMLAPHAVGLFHDTGNNRRPVQGGFGIMIPNFFVYAAFVVAVAHLFVNVPINPGLYMKSVILVLWTFTLGFAESSHLTDIAEGDKKVDEGREV